MNVQALSSALQSFSSALQTTQNKQTSEEPAVFPAKTSGDSATPQEAAHATPQEVAQAMESVKQAVAGISDMARNLQFSIDEGSGHAVVKIVDPETKQVIQQIPSVQLLEIAKSLETSTGLLLKQKA
jgi:flagellar protein FlaG